jgi:hypothetical protein
MSMSSSTTLTIFLLDFNGNPDFLSLVGALNYTNKIQLLTTYVFILTNKLSVESLLDYGATAGKFGL